MKFLNTILLFIVLGTLGFIGTKTINNNDRLIAVSIQLAEAQKSIHSLQADVKSIQSDIMPRAEIEAKLLDIRTTLTSISVIQQKNVIEIERLKLLVEKSKIGS